MENVGLYDRPTLLVFNSKRAILDRIARPALAAVAGPDIDLAGLVEFDPACDEALEQRLVDVDRVGVDGILVAGVDLREGADVSETHENDGNIRKLCVSR